jgi:hypothetical protein
MDSLIVLNQTTHLFKSVLSRSPHSSYGAVLGIINMCAVRGIRPKTPRNSEWRKACISLGVERLGRNFDRHAFFGTALGAAALAGAETDGLPQPTSVVIHGMDKMEYLEHTLEVVKTFKQLTPAQIAELAGKARQVALTRKYELFKTIAHFDSTAKIPSWLG